MLQCYQTLLPQLSHRGRPSGPEYCFKLKSVLQVMEQLGVRVRSGQGAATLDACAPTVLRGPGDSVSRL